MGDVLLVSLRGHGHFRPLMALGERLATLKAAGLRPHLLVVLPTPTELPTQEFPAVNVITMVAPAEASGGPAFFDWMADHRDDIVKWALSAVKELHPLCVIYDSVATWGPSFAKELGVKHIASCSIPLYCYYLWMRGWLFCDSPPHCMDGIEIAGLGPLSLPEMPDIRTSGKYDVQMRLQFGQMRSMIVNDSPAEPGFDALRKVIESELLVEDPRFGKGMCYPLGYASDLSISTEPSRTPELEWLDRQAPNSVIFIALGSWVQMSASNLAAFSEGIASTGRPFLWALRERKKDSDSEPPPPGPTDDTGLPADYRTRVADRALIIPWVNQTAVLRHPALCLFVTHCGWNSLTEGLSLTPVAKAFLPCVGDQLINADVAEHHWQVGISLWTEPPPQPSCTQHDVHDRIEKLLSNEVVRSAANRIYAAHQEHRRSGSAHYLNALLDEILK